MSKLGIVITILLALLLGGGIYVFLETHEKKEKTIHTGLFGEARKNPLYAGRVFLKRMGIPTETKTSVQGFTGYPSSDTVMVINSKRTTVSAYQTQQLINWVQKGGHVIALATNKWRFHRSDKSADADEKLNDFQSTTIDSKLTDNFYSPDPLQNYMGISTGKKAEYDDLSEAEQTQLDKIEEQDDSGDEDENGGESTENLFKIKLSDSSKELAIINSWFHPILVAEEYRDQTEIIKLRSSNFIVRQKIGSGLVTLVSSLDFIENKQLEKADHAEIFWHLIHGINKPIDQPSKVWLIHSDKMPPLWDLIWRNAWMFILSILFLFIAWLLLATRRFGPAIPKLSKDRRSLTEHISSSGSFYWKHNHKKELLESTRDAVNQKLVLSHPNWNHLNEEQQLSLLVQDFKLSKNSELSKNLELNPKEIHRALYAPSIEQADEFTNTIRILETIRQAKANKSAK